MVDHFEGRGFAGYIRVSSDRVDFERSVAAQKDEIQKFAQERGSGPITWYIDKGTGIALPALQSLRADAGSPDPGFDTVLMPGLPSPVSTRCWCTVSPG
jgi:DNA invertase Pin-like site-specific DNA recombinase